MTLPLVSAVLLSAALLRWMPGAALSPGAELEQFTGAHTRVVWMRDNSEELRQDGYGGGFELMALDSRDGRGARPVLAESGSYFRPLITPDGERIVFTDSLRREVLVVNWDGSGLRRLRPGMAGDVWRDPEGVDWVYGKDAMGAEATDRPVIRYRLDDPGKAEVVWKKTPSEIVVPGNLQMSRLGAAASLTFPWPSCGVARFASGSWTPIANGCWPSIAPDRSLVSWIFDGSHRHLTMHEPREGREWRIDLSGAPGIDGKRTYHPRWSNHPLFMTMTGPYLRGKKRSSSSPDVHVGKFKDDLSAIDAWFNVTRSEHAEIFPDVWIASGDESRSALDPGDQPEPVEIAHPELGDRWPASTEGLLFLWKNNRVGSTPAGGQLGPIAITPNGATRFGPAHELALRNGGAVASSKMGLAENIAAAGAFTVEFVAAPAAAGQSGAIVSLQGDDSRPLFSIVERAGDLLIADASGRETLIGPLPAGRKTHVLVASSGGKLNAFLDGQPSALATGSVIDPSSWPPGASLTLGGAHSGRGVWAGTLEGLAVYARGIGAAEAAKQASLFAGILAQRPPRQSWELEAEMVSREEAPEPSEVAPYKRALVVNTYRVADGELPVEGGEFRLAEWAMLDGEEPASYRNLRPGERRRMRLERFEENPQLESERLISDDIDFELFVESEVPRL